MPAASLHRRLLVATALALYAVVFVVFVLFETPGLGLGHFFYLPVALVALSFGVRIGLASGALGAGLYALAIVVTPRLPVRDVLTAATAIRAFTFCSIGALVGWFASRHRQDLERLRELAERDFLTGILNTRVFDEALARRCRSGQPFLLLLGDLDDLKAINDTHGHIAGNNELRRLAEALVLAIGPGDELARVGGDEFAILTAGFVADAAAHCASLREALRVAGLRMTFGWASAPDDGTSPIDLFRKADDRLYAAKLIQRNHRVVQQLARARS